jgi:hypothetical protein
MVGRLGLGVATALSLLTTGGLYAQGIAPAPGSQAFSSNAFTSPSAYAPAAYGQPGQGPAPIVQGASPFGTPQPVVPAGYSQDPNAAMGAPCPGGCPGGNAYGSMPGCGNGDSPDDFVETPWEELLCRALRNADIRLDYINWGISRPATTLIGENPGPGVLQPKFAQIPIGSFGGQVIYVPSYLFGFYPMSVQKNPTDIFPILNTGGAQVGQARAYDTTGISLAENSGFKGTFSLPMTYGTIEASGFILGKANSAPNVGGLPQGIIGESESFAAIPVDVGGQASNAVALFSQSFNQYFSSFVYGAEANVYFNAIVPKDYGLVLKPMVGFRYLGIDEHFDVVATNPGVPATTVESSTISNIYGPSVGVRVELMTQWFSIGVDPRVTFGVNQFAANVNSSDPNTGDSHDHDIDVRFAPVGAIDAYLKIPIQEHIRLYAAYNLLGTTNISRPQSQIDYNVTTGGLNDTHLSLSSAGIMIQGYEVGCEFNF